MKITAIVLLASADAGLVNSSSMAQTTSSLRGSQDEQPNQKKESSSQRQRRLATTYLTDSGDKFHADVDDEALFYGTGAKAEVTNCPRDRYTSAINGHERYWVAGTATYPRTLTYTRPLISGLRWSGDFAGSVQLECYTPDKDDGYFSNLEQNHDLVFNAVDQENFAFVKPGNLAASFGNSHTAYISEEHGGARPHQTQCEADAWAVQVSCYNHHCDNVQLTCAKYVGITWGECRWTDNHYSDESGLISFADTQEFLTGINCSGRFCDNMHYRVCKLEGYATN